jgi:uncharacterized phage protein (TIGR01671 family)
MDKRIIKFRAFHKERKEMYNVHGWHSEFIFKDTLDGVGCEGNPDFVENVVLMQFTGLKDKNGIQIYEGDIIEYTQHHFNTDMTKTKTKVVSWKRDMWGVYETSAGESSIKVIGNVFENPELL